MEAKIWCAHNVSRSCKISSKVIVTDYGSAPFKLMKLMLDGLAKDADAGFWLTNLSQTPQIVRLFPFDFLYLDSEGKLIQAVELPPEAKLPRFHPLAASALILPLNSLSASGTAEGDTIMIVSGEGVEAEPARSSAPSVPMRDPVRAPVFNEPVPFKLSELRNAPDRTPAPKTLGGPTISTQLPSIAASQGTGHTVALSTRWQISKSTPTGVLLENFESTEAELTSGTVPSITNPSDIHSLGLEKNHSAEELIELSAEITGPETELKPATTVAQEIFAIPDTDFAAIIDSAIEEEIGNGKLQESSSIELADATTVDANVKAHGSTGIAESSAEKLPARTETSGPTQPSEASKAISAARDKSTAPARTTPANGSRKPGPTKAPEPLNAPNGQETQPSGRFRKRSFGYIVKEFLNCPDPLPESRTTPRLVQQGIVAFETTGDTSMPMEVRDVSPSGLYLRTKKRWQLRKVFTLTLQRKGTSEDEFQSRVNVRVAAVRNDRDGVGFSWVLPKNVTFDPWRRVHTKRSDETDLQFFIREIRLTKALAFLQEICPVSAEEIKHALQERFSNKRVASAVEIALKAEDLLERNPHSGPLLAHSEIVTRVLENGSWIEDDWIRKMWAGLLVSACTTDGSDKTNLAFLELMARLTPIHLRILSYVCKKAVETISPDKPEAKLEIYCSTKELMEAADSHSFQRILQTIGHLSNFGLFQDVLRPSYSAADDKMSTRTTPTPLGLKMYAHCLGQRT